MSDLRDSLQTSLGAAYTLERELGGGGMSRVFVAEDVMLRRRVVIKLLPGELAAAVSVERFKREIALAARKGELAATLTVMDAMKARNELPPFLEQPLNDLHSRFRF